MSVDVHVGHERSLGGPAGWFRGAHGPAVALDLLPLASLVLAADGSAVAVNEEWALLSAMPGGAWRGDGWLSAVEPVDREPLRRQLAGAVAAGKPGSADFRLSGSGGGRRSRWWWRPGTSGQLMVCVADLDRAETPTRVVSPAAGDDPVDVATFLVHRLSGVGLALESASGLADGPVAARLQHAVDELDAVIRDIRTAAFGSRTPGRRPR
jgi:hypothetical protein